MDDFLNMMSDGGSGDEGGGGGSKNLLAPKPAYMQFTGPMLECFLLLTDAMYKKGDENLVTHGKFQQSYKEAADELKTSTDLTACDYGAKLANEVNNHLTMLSKPITPANYEHFMSDIVDICSKYLSQYAEYNKDKGPAFRLLVKTMKTKGETQLFQKEKIKKSYITAAKDLEVAKGLENDHDDPDLSTTIKTEFNKLMEGVTPDDLKNDMPATIDLCSKYLSQLTIDELERGPMFEKLIKELEHEGAEHFCDYPSLATRFAAAHALKSAPGLSSSTPDPATAPMFSKKLHLIGDPLPLAHEKADMNAVIERCANYLSAFMRDRDAATQALVEMMKSNGSNTFAQIPSYKMDYATGAREIEEAPALVPYHPIKDIADEGKENLSRDMANVTPPQLQVAMKAVISDAAKHLSQPFALRSGIAGKRYPLEFLAHVKKSLGKRSLFKYKAFGQSYSDAATTLLHSGPLELDPKDATHSMLNLHHEIKSEWKVGMPLRLAPTIAEELHPTMDDAAKHLATLGMQKGQALEHLVNTMKEKGDATLGTLQGYDQSYQEGGRRLEIARSLDNDKVEKHTYEGVKGKLDTLIAGKASGLTESQARHLPELVDQSSKYLSAPTPESESEKREVLATLMSREGDKLVGKEGIYKMTLAEGGEEIKKGAVKGNQAYDEEKKKVVLDKVNAVIPTSKMQELLKDTANQGAAHLTDVIKGRGDALDYVHQGIKKEMDKGFLDVGDFKSTYEETAQMVHDAPHFTGKKGAASVLTDVTNKVDKAAPTLEAPSHIKEEHMKDVKDIVSKYIAGVATEKSGLDPSALANYSGDSTDAKAAGKVGGKEGGIEGGRAGGREGGREGGIEGGSAGGREGGREGGIEGGRAGGREGGREGGIEGGREGGIEGGRAGGREGGREGGTEGGREGGRQGGGGRAGSADTLRGLRGADGLEAGMADASTGALGAAGDDEEERRRRAALRDRQRQKRYGDAGTDADLEREAALKILHRELQARDKEVFYEQPFMSFTHKEASAWLSEPHMKVEPTVKNSGDTARLHKKFEKKLNTIVSPVTPVSMIESMQDVVIESARYLSERYVAQNYKAHAREALISEMQKRGNEILTEVEGDTETSFFAAQRLKKATDIKTDEPCTEEAPRLTRKLDEIMRYHSTPRKLAPTIKDYTKDAADYLSTLVTKPDEQISAYVALLEEMEAAGDAPLITGPIPKSHEEAAAYLRTLTSFDDKINRQDSSMKNNISSKLTTLMANVTPIGYTKSTRDNVIKHTAGLLASYVTLEAQKTEALNVMIEHMDEAGNAVLLRHGNVRKSYKDGANLLRGKTTDQLSVTSADPVVARKIEIKLHNLMAYNTPDKHKPVMKEVIEDATMYLAVHLLQPTTMKVCKCMKNEFIQCELWCEDILRRMAKPPCTCSRHISVQDVKELAPMQQLRICPGSSRRIAPNLEISVTPCRSKKNISEVCQAARPSSGCLTKERNPTASYAVQSTTYHRNLSSDLPIKLPKQTSTDPADSRRLTSTLFSPGESEQSMNVKSLLMEIHSQNLQYMRRTERDTLETMASSTSSYISFTSKKATVTERRHSRISHLDSHRSSIVYARTSPCTNNTELPGTSQATDSIPSAINSRTSISTDQMADWHAMMVSLMWNIQAWKKWIQENIDRGVKFQQKLEDSWESVRDSWATFQRRVSTEALQWRQYSIFSSQLIARLVARYSDKEILSPSRTVKTESYRDCASEMLDIIQMFNRWTQCLTLVVKESSRLQQQVKAKSELSDPATGWLHYKIKMAEYAKDWVRYNLHLKLCWEQKYQTFISECVPYMSASSPVWVVSACGAVPSGAASAGVFEGEPIWIARTTHRCKVLPAALHPSKHCCIVYSEGVVHHYTKYQVMCNAEVKWVGWRGSSGGVSSLAVRVAEGVYVGRVLYRGSHLLGAVFAPHYRCHVVIFGKPFAFKSYELLFLTNRPPTV